MQKQLKYSFIVLVILLVLSIIYWQLSKHQENSTSTYRMEVHSLNDSYIYEIYNNDTLYIRQEYIPAIEGKHVFKSRRDAELIGQLVLQKLKQNLFPVVTKEEIIDNHITFNPK